MKASEYRQAPFFPQELFGLIKAAKAWCRAMNLKPSRFAAGGIVEHAEGYTVGQSMVFLEFSKLYTSEYDKVKLSHPHDYQFSSMELETTFRNWLEFAELDVEKYNDPVALFADELTDVEYCTIQWYIEFYHNVVYLELNPPVDEEESTDEDVDNFMQQLVDKSQI